MKWPHRLPSAAVMATTLVVAVMAALPLWAIAVYQWPIAQGDTWIFIQSYIGYQEGRTPWTALLSSHGPHPGMLLRPIVLLPLSIGSGDFSPLTWLSWLTAAASFVFIALLLQRQAKGLPLSAAAVPGDGGSFGLAALVVVAAALVFSMGQGLAWTWEFVWINWLPGACLAALLWIDVRHMQGGSSRITLPGWLLRFALALLAMIAFGNGMFVWLALVFGWTLRHWLGHPAAPGWRAQATWGAVFALLTWLLILRPAEEGDGIGLAALLERPLMTVHYVLCLVGSSFANGSDLDPSIQAAAVGGFICLLLGGGLIYGFRHRHDPALQNALLPWFQAASVALLASLLIAMGRMDQTVYTAFASRYLTLTFWLPLAAAAISVFCVRHWLAQPGLSNPAQAFVWRRRFTIAGCLLAGCALPLWIAQGTWGLHDMRWYHREKLTVAAAYQFAEVLPDEVDRALRDVSVGRQDSVRFLIDRGQLPGIDPVATTSVADLRLRTDLNDTVWSALETGEHLRIQGHARMNSRREPPDLVLVTVAPGQAAPDAVDHVAALIAVQRPRDFDRRHYHINVAPHHHLHFGDDIPWSNLRQALDRWSTGQDDPDETVRIRLYGVDFRSRVVRRLAGEQVLNLPDGETG